LKSAAQKLKIATPTLAPADILEIERYPWPGNVRELQNVIERAAILAAHGRFSLLHLAANQRSISVPAPTHDPEKEAVVSALRTARGKIYGPNGAAALLGIKPTTLASKLVRLRLKREEFLHG
jgi:DNA-binding NtrC family response regulator